MLASESLLPPDRIFSAESRVMPAVSWRIRGSFSDSPGAQADSESAAATIAGMLLRIRVGDMFGWEQYREARRTLGASIDSSRIHRSSLADQHAPSRGAYAVAQDKVHAPLV